MRLPHRPRTTMHPKTPPLAICLEETVDAISPDNACRVRAGSILGPVAARVLQRQSSDETMQNQHGESLPLRKDAPGARGFECDLSLAVSESLRGTGALDGPARIGRDGRLQFARPKWSKPFTDRHSEQDRSASFGMTPCVTQTHQPPRSNKWKPLHAPYRSRVLSVPSVGNRCRRLKKPSFGMPASSSTLLPQSSTW